MKILIINYEFPPLGGGGGRASAHLASEMGQLGHEVLVVTSAFQDLPSCEKRENYEIQRIWTLRKYEEKCRVFEMLVFLISSLFNVWRISVTWKPDITIPFFTIPSGPSAWLLKKLKKIPYIVSLPGGDVPGFMKDQLRWFHFITRPFIRKIWQDAKSVVANSEGLKELALKTTPNLDIKVIPNGVDTEYYCNSELARGSDKMVTILTVGRLSPQKGIAVLLNAFAQLKKQVSTPVQLLIAGDGPLRQELEELSKTLCLENQVVFYGWCDPDEVLTLYRQADIFTLASFDEGMPNVMLEAMAVGLPIVATNIAGSCELVSEGENGFLVPAGESGPLAESLLRLVNDPSLRISMGHKSRELVNNYSWKKVGEGYVGLV